MTLGFDFRICSQDQTTFKATHDVKLIRDRLNRVLGDHMIKHLALALLKC